MQTTAATMQPTAATMQTTAAILGASVHPSLLVGYSQAKEQSAPLTRMAMKPAENPVAEQDMHM